MVVHKGIVAQGHPPELIVEHAAENVIEIEGPGPDLREYVKKYNIRHDDLEERIIIYTNAQQNLENEVRKKFCMDSCIFRAGNLEDVFLRLTGRELRE